MSNLILILQTITNKKSLQTCGLSFVKVSVFILLAFLAAFFEGLSLAMFLPLIETIGMNSYNDSNQTFIYIYIIKIFNSFNIEVNLLNLLFSILLFLILRVVFTYLRLVYVAWLKQEILHKTRSSFYEAYLNSSFSFYDEFNTGKAVNLVTTETERIGSFFNSIFQVIVSFALLITYATLSLLLSYQFTIMAFSVVVLTYIISTYLTKNILNLGKQVTSSIDELSQKFVEKIYLVRLTKLFNYSIKEIIDFDKISLKAGRDRFNVQKSLAKLELIIEPIVVLMALVTFYISITKFNATASNLALLMIILMRLIPYLKSLMKYWNGFLSLKKSFLNFNSHLNTAIKNKEEDFEDLTIWNSKFHTISFKNVYFKYNLNNKKYILNNIDLKIYSKKITCIIGPSGSGKSTLINLLTKIRIPNNGKIYFDDIDYNNFSLKTLRQNISLVSQNSEILNDTIRKNLNYGEIKHDDLSLISLSEDVGLNEFINANNDGLDSILGERGSKLSGGQIQKIALMRALIQNKDIIILDEPTSSLDFESEQNIMSYIKLIQHKYNKTIIMITHKLNLIDMVDNVIILEEGCVKFEGTKSELQLDNNWFKKFKTS